MVNFSSRPTIMQNVQFDVWSQNISAVHQQPSKHGDTGSQVLDQIKITAQQIALTKCKMFSFTI